MPVEIWKQRFLGIGGYRKVADQVELVQTGPQGVFALLPGPVYAAVSDELAAAVLGARRVPCPYIGQHPVYGMFSSGSFRVYERSLLEEPVTYERCGACGFSRVYHGNPRFNAAFLGTPGDGQPHPFVMKYVTARPRGSTHDITWRKSRFDVTKKDDDGHTVFVWMRGTWHLRKDAWKRAAMARFPRADILVEANDFFVLRGEDENY